MAARGVAVTPLEREAAATEPCPVPGCPGQRESRVVDQVYRYHGRLVVVTGMPARVCDVCGETTIAAEVARTTHGLLEAWQAGRVEPGAWVPALSFPRP